MFDVKIFNGSLDKKYLSTVSFPNGSALSGDIPNVGMVVLDDGTAVFNVSDIIYAITEYDNGRVGVNVNQARDIVKSYFGFGTVVFFRRGGMFADIQALQSITDHFFADSTDESVAYRRVARPSVLYALKTCGANKYTDLCVSDDAKYPVSNLCDVVPSTVEADRCGIYGVPRRKCSEDKPQPENEVINDIDGQPEEPMTKSAAAGTEIPDQAKETTPLEDFTRLSAITALVTQLAAGKKLVVTLSLE